MDILEIARVTGHTREYLDELPERPGFTKIQQHYNPDGLALLLVKSVVDPKAPRHFYTDGKKTVVYIRQSENSNPFDIGVARSEHARLDDYIRYTLSQGVTPRKSKILTSMFPRSFEGDISKKIRELLEEQKQ